MQSTHATPRNKSPGPLNDVERCMAQRQWDAAVAHARAIGLQALEAGRMRVLLKAGGYLERLQDHAFAARLISVGGRMKEPSTLPEWDGCSLSGRTLLVIQRIRHVGAAIRLGRLIPFAAQHASRCIVLAEPRLVPLFKRSFPSVDVRTSGVNDDQAIAEADMIASYETLQYLASDGTTGVPELAPLKPDRNAQAQFRRKYGQGRPLIGMNWYSTNENKDLPALGDWAQFMRALDATFVSIQYGDVSGDVETLRASSGAQLIYDETVDSLVDLDSFAAQIASLDAVVAISNTGAHMAGALDVPMHIILDDNNHLIWPAWGQKTAWYPHATLVRKEKREWAEVFAALRKELDTHLSASRAR